ncbi:mitochondrial glycoprotein [Peziza echinospora]|nr:mitochondrial glycoprotein [Peziza echinospora]
MLALRTFSRLAAPISRVSARSMVTKAPRLTALSVPKFSNAVLRQPLLASRFSTATVFRAAEDSVDAELAAKLTSELELEKEMKGFDDMPDAIKSFLETGTFQVNDTPGHEEVELVRKYGNETIRVEFSISDLNLMGQNDQLDDDSALYDEEDADVPESAQSGGAQSKNAKESRAATNNEIEEDDEVFDESDLEPSFPAHLNIIIEKPNGALKISGLAQDGMIVLQNVIYHSSSDLLKTKSAESDYQSEGLYAGPEFGNLDEDLQVLFERYLDERGINTALALFVPDYIEFKEQREYLTWLENVKNFVQS